MVLTTESKAISQAPALEALEITTRYGSSHREALRCVSLVVAPGEILAVIGPNGAGKTSLVRVLTGLLPVERGEVRLFGQSIAKLDRQSIAKRVAVVGQRSDVAFDYTAEQVVSMGRAPHQGAMLLPRGRDLEIVEHAMSSFGLGSVAQRPVSCLSGGEQKRVAIARAFAQEADVLILDEAEASLDIRHKTELMAVVRRRVLDRRVACLAVMHDLSLASQVADRVAVLCKGRLIATGAVGEVMTSGVLRETFGIEVYVGTSDQDGTHYFIPKAPVSGFEARDYV